MLSILRFFPCFLAFTLVRLRARLAFLPVNFSMCSAGSCSDFGLIYLGGLYLYLGATVTGLSIVVLSPSDPHSDCGPSLTVTAVASPTTGAVCGPSLAVTAVASPTTGTHERHASLGLADTEVSLA